METFRQMLNDCIRIGIAQKKTSFMSLRYACYPELQKYAIAPAYKNNAISRASGILSNYRKLLKKGRRVKTAYCRNAILTTCKGFTLRIEGNRLVLPQKLKLPLNDYVLKQLEDSELRSVTISGNAISVCYAREVKQIECTGVVGIDTNLENVTAAFDDDATKKFDMKEIVVVKQRYREVKSHLKRNDSRIMEQISQKYGKLQADNAQSEINKVTARIVKRAKKKRLAFALENIKDIRKLYRKGNGQGSNYRARLNSWAFREFQRQIEYKATKEGLKVIYVNARGTSARCSKCDGEMSVEENRMLRCLSCGLRIDRDKNAAINIRKRGLEKLFSMRFGPIGLPNEAVNGNPMKKLPTEVILRADGGQEQLIR
jgi:putative transposase